MKMIVAFLLLLTFIEMGTAAPAVEICFDFYNGSSDNDLVNNFTVYSSSTFTVLTNSGTTGGALDIAPTAPGDARAICRQPFNNAVGSSWTVSLCLKYNEAIRNPFQSSHMLQVGFVSESNDIFDSVGSVYLRTSGDNIQPWIQSKKTHAYLGTHPVMYDGNWYRLSFTVKNKGGPWSEHDFSAAIEDIGPAGNSPPSLIWNITNYTASISNAPTIYAAFGGCEGEAGVDFLDDFVVVTNHTFPVPEEVETVLGMETAVEIVWTSSVSRVYQLQRASTLSTDAWHNVSFPIPGNGSVVGVCQSLRGQTNAFYRIVILE